MLNLRKVKLNNTYTYIENSLATSPATGETLLADKTESTFVIGYTYTYSGSAWDRTETQEDYKINQALMPTVSNTCKWLNNYFWAKRYGDYLDLQSYDNCCYAFDMDFYYKYISVYDDSLVYDASTLTTTKEIEFKTGDLIYLMSSARNKDKFGYITDITGNVFTSSREYTSDTGYGYMVLSQIPEDVECIIANMVWFNVYKRDLTQSGDVSAESEGSYSASYELGGESINGLQYPTSLTSGLKQYKLIRILN